MNVTYSDKVKQSDESIALLEQATKRLEEMLSSSTGLAEAHWDGIEDKEGRLNYNLRISDWAGSASATFTPDELRSWGPLVRYRIYRLWSEVLEIRSHKQLERLQEFSGLES